MSKIIAISLSPNTEKKDYVDALKLLFSPWDYTRRQYIEKLEEWFKKYFSASYAVSFDSGRSAEYVILKSLGIGRGDEVLIQAFTCVAVPNSVLWQGAKPIFVDIEKNSYNIDSENLIRKINKKTKAVIVQHTFGQAAKIEEVCQIAKKYKLVMIEDCAHALGATSNGKKIGTFGDVAFFSFGRDKVVSSVFGGMVITNNKELGEKIRKLQKTISSPSFFWVIQQLLHPVLFSIILPTYNFLNVGKAVLWLAQKLHLLSFPVSAIEKKGEKPTFYPKKMPNALAKLAIVQLERLEKFNNKRRAIARIYAKEFNIKIKNEDIYVRFPIEVDSPQLLLSIAKNREVLLGNWYSHVIDPKDIALLKIGYQVESCPVAEEKAKHIINLPTYPRMSKNDVEKVVEIVKDYVRSKDN